MKQGEKVLPQMTTVIGPAYSRRRLAGGRWHLQRWVSDLIPMSIPPYRKKSGELYLHWG